MLALHQEKAAVQSLSAAGYHDDTKWIFMTNWRSLQVSVRPDQVSSQTKVYFRLQL